MHSNPTHITSSPKYGDKGYLSHERKYDPSNVSPDRHLDLAKVARGHGAQPYYEVIVIKPSSFAQFSLLFNRKLTFHRNIHKEAIICQDQMRNHLLDVIFVPLYSCYNKFLVESPRLANIRALSPGANHNTHKINST